MKETKKHIIAQISSRHFNAVAAAAAKGDVRACLNGIYLDFAHGVIVGTNGSVLCAAPFDSVEGDPTPEDSLIITRPAPAVSPGSTTTMIEITERRVIATVSLTSFNRRANAKRHFADVVHDVYPDWRRVIAPVAPEGESRHHTIGISPMMLAPIQKALRAKCCALRFGREPTDMIHVEWIDHEDVQTVLMPVRI